MKAVESYEIDTPVKKLAVQLYRHDAISKNTQGPWKINFEKVDWEAWYSDSATMPLSGPGFVAQWEGMARLALDFAVDLNQ